jgi:hypothetical protein
MRYIYILFIFIIIYYLFLLYVKKYFENFDPSLVPVSSIINLAKSAQKIIDGNGTLSNITNFIIGTPSSTANLSVTGYITTNDLTINGGEIVNDSTIGNLTAKNSTFNNLTINGSNKITGNLHIIGDNTISIDEYINGNLTVNGTTTTNNLVVNGNKTINNDLNITGKINHIPKGTIIMFYGTTIPYGWVLCDGTNDTPDLRNKVIKSGNGINGSNLSNNSGGVWGSIPTERIEYDYYPFNGGPITTIQVPMYWKMNKSATPTIINKFILNYIKKI